MRVFPTRLMNIISCMQPEYMNAVRIGCAFVVLLSFKLLDHFVYRNSSLLLYVRVLLAYPSCSVAVSLSPKGAWATSFLQGAYVLDAAHKNPRTFKYMYQFVDARYVV